MLRPRDLRPDVRDGLQHHARHVQVRAVPLARVADDVVHDDLLQPGDVAEGYGPSHEREGGTAARGAQGAVFVVGGAVVPAAEALAGGTGEGAGRVVGVH